MLAEYIKDNIHFKKRYYGSDESITGTLMFTMTLSNEMCSDLKWTPPSAEDVIKNEMVQSLNHDVVEMIRQIIHKLYEIKYSMSIYSPTVGIIDEQIAEMNEKLRLYSGV